MYVRLYVCTDVLAKPRTLANQSTANALVLALTRCVHVFVCVRMCVCVCVRVCLHVCERTRKQKAERERYKKRIRFAVRYVRPRTHTHVQILCALTGESGRQGSEEER